MGSLRGHSGFPVLVRRTIVHNTLGKCVANLVRHFLLSPRGVVLAHARHRSVALQNVGVRALPSDVSNEAIKFRIIETAHCADPLGGINLECVSSLLRICCMLR